MCRHRVVEPSCWGGRGRRPGPGKSGGSSFLRSPRRRPSQQVRGQGGTGGRQEWEKFDFDGVCGGGFLPSAKIRHNGWYMQLNLVMQVWLETSSVHLQEERRGEAVEVLWQAVGVLVIEADAAPELAEHVVLPVGELLGPSSSPRFNEIPAESHEYRLRLRLPLLPGASSYHACKTTSISHCR
ncbi:uncharacterized protein LOC124652844 isoform X2 [Lolium rigidum]|uniref:uncharacterized protein LOC124652844 isoform X2 n=1 Tax=Lolium rigidum TaxID=89674 RepID=UPI001F5D2A23|nr:uncharacterized protein LOC124652844 isoform X2 [Lolium rigidum]